MVSAINTSLSGLEAAGRRIEVAAQNIANQNTTLTQVNGVESRQPYLPQDIVQISEAGGGVRTVERTATEPTTQRFDPSNTNGDSLETVPNVNVAEQLVNLQIASYDYQANLKAIKVASSIEQSLLDIVA